MRVGAKHVRAAPLHAEQADSPPLMATPDTWAPAKAKDHNRDPVSTTAGTIRRLRRQLTLRDCPWPLPKPDLCLVCAELKGRQVNVFWEDFCRKRQNKISSLLARLRVASLKNALRTPVFPAAPFGRMCSLSFVTGMNTTRPLLNSHLPVAGMGEAERKEMILGTQKMQLPLTLEFTKSLE